MTRHIKFNNPISALCPKCYNCTEFTIYSKQYNEELYEIVAVCKCGFDPTKNHRMYRHLEIYGAIDDNNVLHALIQFKEVITEKHLYDNIRSNDIRD